MSDHRVMSRRRVRRGRVFQVEFLEDRQLLATAVDSITWPSLSGLIQQAYQGKDTSRATINTMVKALQTQLTNGPLADLKAGAVNEDAFVVEVQDVVASFDQSVTDQLLPRFKNIGEMLQIQGQRMSDTMAALNQANLVNLSTSTELETQAQAAIESLTSGPIYSLGTPLTGFVSVTQTFENSMRALSTALTTTSPLTPAQAGLTLQAEAEAYRTTMFAGLLITHTDYANLVGTAIDTLDSTARNIATQEDSGTAKTLLDRAIAAFDTAILDTSGLFGSTGYAGLANAKYGFLPHNVGTDRVASSFSDVSGTGTFGETGSLSATLTAADGSPVTGQVVNFTLNGAYAGTAVTDSAGVAVLDGVPVTGDVGTQSNAISVTFAGSGSNRASTGSGDLDVQQVSTTTTLTAAPNPSSAGQLLVLTATVATTSGTGTPTGTVTFYDGSTVLGTDDLDTDGVAAMTTSALSLGTHSLTAVYAGDSNHIGSTSTAVSQVVNPATTTALSSSANPSVSGQSVTFTATVTPTSSSGTPTGTVTFRDGTTTLGTGSLASGVATFSTSSLNVSTHSITAVYGGDTSFGSSTSTAVSQVVNQAATATALNSSANPSVSGQSVTFTATVTTTSPGTGTPTGTVNFLDGTTTLGTGTLSASGIATFTTNSLSVATHSITAVYVASTNFATSTSPVVSQVVNPATTTTSLTSGLNPSTDGQSVTFTATVNTVSPGTGTATGTVNFLDGVTVLGTGTLNSGIATFNTSTLTVGAHSITAAYLGATNFGTSTSGVVNQTVNAT